MNISFILALKIPSSRLTPYRPQGSKTLYNGIPKISLLILSLALGLGGCAILHVTKVNSKHPLLQNTVSNESASVYFIRPHTEHPQGFADNPLKIYADDSLLMTLGKGEYTLVYLKTQPMSLTLTNLTQTRGWWEIEMLKQTRQFEFDGGKTYFIVAQPVDGEFRGVHFTPKNVSQFDAKKILADRVTPVGNARQFPIK